MESNIQTHPSLRCQAHWQNAQSQRDNQILLKSLPARPTPAYGQIDNAANLKAKKIENNKGQLVKQTVYGKPAPQEPPPTIKCDPLSKSLKLV